MPLRSPGFLFYAINPTEHAYEKVEDVPSFVSDAIPWFIILIAIELLVSAMQGVAHRRYRFKETLCSFALGLVLFAITLVPFLRVLFRRRCESNCRAQLWASCIQ